MTEVITIRPMDLVAGKHVNFHMHDTGTGIAPAYVQVEHDKNGRIQHYDLHIYRQTCIDIFFKTPYAKSNTPFDSFLLGVLIHEILHILSEIFFHVPQYDDSVIQYLWNVIMDSHDEYKGAFWFPSYAPFINLCLSCMQHTTPATKESPLKTDLATWYHLVRFGVAHPDADPDFLNFAIKCALPGIRGTSYDALQSSYAIYEYLRLKHQNTREWSEALTNDDRGQSPITGDEMQAIKEMVQIFESDKTEVLKGVIGGDFEKLAGVQSVDINYDFSDNSFYISTVNTFLDAINEIASRFSRFIDAPELVKSYDGDMGLSIHEQMSLYQSSFTGEDTLSYYRNVIERPEIDAVVCHDISGSTDDFKTEFAQACIIFFAAFEKVTGIRLAYIRFNGDAKTVFEFDQEPQKAAFDPRSMGGTSFCPVLDLAQAMDWRGQSRLCFIITDGDAYDSYEAINQIEDMRTNLGIHTYILEIVKNYSEKTGLTGKVPYAYKSTLADLSGKLINRLIIDILRDRNQVA